MKKLIIVVLMVCIAACTKEQLKYEIKDFRRNPIEIPYSKLDKRACSMFTDTRTSDKTLRLINYLDFIDCTACASSKFAMIEERLETERKLKCIECLYIINTKIDDVEDVYVELCNARIKGDVYFDTCSAFLQANPHFPDNPLLHTFILNKKDSVVLFGDPFKNEKMENLLLKVIEREKQRLENEQNK